jgi:DNA polymerase
MTNDGKAALKDLLNLASDYLKDGHTRAHKTEEPAEKPAEKAALPLAYMVEEEDEGEDSLEAVAADAGACTACGLAVTRKNTVPGEGAVNPLVMVIGEGPGADEDAAGRPFVGRAGQLLDKMLGSIGLVRGKNCYIANMVKCRPPGNRNPETVEISACYPFLERQIILLKPVIILCAGNVATQNILKTSRGITAMRGQFAEFKIGELTIPVLPTYHPSALLRDESMKRPAWEDLKLLKSRLVEMNLL